MSFSFGTQKHLIELYIKPAGAITKSKKLAIMKNEQNNSDKRTQARNLYLQSDLSQAEISMASLKNRQSLASHMEVIIDFIAIVANQNIEHARIISEYAMNHFAEAIKNPRAPHNAEYNIPHEEEETEEPETPWLMTHSFSQTCDLRLTALIPFRV